MPRRLPLAFVALLGGIVALTSYRFLLTGLEAAFPSMGPHIGAARLAFLAHVSASPVALALGAFQFMPRLRAGAPGLHRWAGRLYAAAILVGGIGALAMVPHANGGLLSSLGFLIVAVLWLVTTAQAVRLALLRRFAQHRRWMIRSFALTFASVTLRLELLPFQLAGIPYVETIPYLVWTSWTPNIIAAEWWLRRRP